MINLKAILLGWTNWFKYNKLPTYQKEIFSERVSVCKSNECGEYRLGICTACGCPVSAKSKVLSELCPENMWTPTVYEYNDTKFINLEQCNEYLRGKYLVEHCKFINEDWAPTDAVELSHWLKFLKAIEQP